MRQLASGAFSLFLKLIKVGYCFFYLRHFLCRYRKAAAVQQDDIAIGKTGNFAYIHNVGAADFKKNRTQFWREFFQLLPCPNDRVFQKDLCILVVGDSR